jgi:N6-adenosine-specific RNA methylase IME4
MRPQCHEVMTAWGFTYKSDFVWDKDEIGTGYWNRNQHEYLLIGTRGNPPAPAPGTQFPSVFHGSVREHSRKPDIAYEIIEAMFPNLPRIELNATRRRKGWMSWGTLECDDPTEEGDK